MTPITMILRRLERSSWEQYHPPLPDIDTLKDADRILFSTAFSLRNVAGQNTRLRLILVLVDPGFDTRGRVDRRENLHPAALALLKEDEEGLVSIFVSPTARDNFESESGRELTWQWVSSESNLRQIRATLEHELVHAADIIDLSKDAFRPRTPTPTDGWGPITQWPVPELKDMWTERAQYLNRTHELRASMPQILNEIRDEIKRRVPRSSTRQTKPKKRHRDYLSKLLDEVFAEPVAPAVDLNYIILDALTRSPTWREMQYYLTQRSQNFIFKALVTALEDEGIITIE